MFTAFSIFLLTMVLVIWQPKGLGVGWSASLGAILALLAGVVTLDDIPLVWSIVWNATATFISLIIISLLLDEAGFFQWAALHVARWAKGDGRRLFVFTILLGAGVSALFANDGAALILTPHRRFNTVRIAFFASVYPGVRHGGRFHCRHGELAPGGVQPRQHRFGRLLRPGFQRIRRHHGAGQCRCRGNHARGAVPVFPA